MTEIVGALDEISGLRTLSHEILFKAALCG
jgi:hypothetical protein